MKGMTYTQCFVAGLAMGCVELAGASVLNLDWGSTSVGSATRVDPYHVVTGDLSNLTWNTALGTGNISAGALKYGDGTTASGVAITVGVTGTSTKTVPATSSLLTTSPSTSSPLGDFIKTGIYAGTSPAVDAIFDRNGGANNRGIALQISGLPAGKYDIYYVGRNTNTNNGDTSQDYTYSATIYAGKSSSAGNFTFSSYGKSTITYDLSNLQTNDWVLGGTYAKATIDLVAGDKLNLAFLGGNAELRGFVNSLQIVSIPEPLGVSVLAMGSALLSVRRRRA